MKFDEGVPLAPLPPRMKIFDRLIHKRRDSLRAQRDRIARELEVLRESWIRDCVDGQQSLFERGTQFERDLRVVLKRHQELFDQYRDDVDKFLYKVALKLAKYDSDYSWKIQAELDNEILDLLNGILAEQSAVNRSLGFLARCGDPSLVGAYSQPFLEAELERRYQKHRSAPRPDFQLTLDYVRRLEGTEFEEWLRRLLVDGGVSRVRRTQASRDQGADLIVEIGHRVIAIQAKRYPDNPVGNSAVQEVHSAKGFYDATDACVVTTATSFTRDAIDLAHKLSVRLIPGTQLSNLPAILRELAAGDSEQEDVPSPRESGAAARSAQLGLSAAEQTSRCLEVNELAKTQQAEMPPVQKAHAKVTCRLCHLATICGRHSRVPDGDSLHLALDG